MMVKVVRGMVLTPLSEDALIPEESLVVFAEPDSDRVILTAVEPKAYYKTKPESPARVRYYFTAPREYSRRALEAELNGEAPRKIRFGALRIVTNTDRELERRRGMNKGQLDRPPAQKRRRDERWMLIRPLVENSVDELLLDSALLREKVEARAREVAGDKSLSTVINAIDRTLNQYWARGSTKEGLQTFHSRCGARGKARLQRTKLGRPSTKLEGKVLTKEDKENIHHAWNHFRTRRTTNRKAYRKMLREFYSITIMEAERRVHELLAPENCPSLNQFCRWGPMEDPNEAARRKMLNPQALARIDRSLMGWSNERIVAVGQRGSCDSSPPDLQLVSLMNRLRRIGGANRILLVDLMYGYIPGFYLGIDSPSTATVKLALLHAMSDKRKWLEHLGLEEQANAWIPIRFRSLIADNTDLRTRELQEDLQRMGTNLLYVPTARSDLNAGAECGHHALHRMSDHNLLGTTFGRHHERGEEQADVAARLTIFEAIRETARAIYTKNTTPLERPPTLAEARAGVELTPLALTKWALEEGRSAGFVDDPATYRAHLMPVCRGAFTEKGVRLLRWDKGNAREYIDNLFYVAIDPETQVRIIEAKTQRTRRQPESFDEDFYVNPYDPRVAFYRSRNSNELVQLEGKSRDSDLLEEGTLYDFINVPEECTRLRAENHWKHTGSFSRMESGQEQTCMASEAAYQHDLEQASKPPSKAAMKRDKQKHREEERDVLVLGTSYTPLHAGKARSKSDAKPNADDNKARSPQDGQIEKRRDSLLSSVIRGN